MVSITRWLTVLTNLSKREKSQSEDSIMDRLDAARRAINEIDKEMAELFVKRMEASYEVGQYKLSHGLPVFDPDREAEVLRRNSARVEDETLRSYYVNFLQTCMDLSKSYQRRIQNGLRVAYSGVEGAFAFIAAKRIFPDGNLCAFGDFKSAYNAVANGECDCCVLPIENSYAGEVSQVIDLLFKGTLYINGVYDLEITQNLIGPAGTSRSEVKTVISHPQALMQCAGYIKKHGLKAVDANNTALAAKQVAEAGDKSLAAIASEDTAELYGLEVIEKNINENSNNTTRFAVLSRVEKKTEVDDSSMQSILVFTVKNEAGALAKAVTIIGNSGFNMRTLRSRSMKKLLWQYYFYVEVDGNAHSKKGQEMLKALSSCCDRLRIVGTFAHETDLK